MALFVIHTSDDRRLAKNKLRKMKEDFGIQFEYVFLNNTYDEDWKESALNAMLKAEAIIVFNPKSCEKSANSKWEIEKAKERNYIFKWI